MKLTIVVSSAICKLHALKVLQQIRAIARSSQLVRYIDIFAAAYLAFVSPCLKSTSLKITLALCCL